MQARHVYANVLKATAAVVLTATLTPHAFAIDPKADTDGEAAKFVANYQITKVGLRFPNFDYNRITEPGTVLVVRVPGIYSDVANTKHAIINTDITNGNAEQQKGILAGLTDTHNSRQLQPGETVYITKLEIKPSKGIVFLELLTTEQTQRGGWDSTRYRAEVNIHIDNLASAKADEVKKIINQIAAPPEVANAVQSKSVDIGMGQDQVKQILGNPDNIINLGPKTIFVYKNMKVIFIDAKVSDVQ